MTPSDETPPDTLLKIHKVLFSGLLYTHSRINDNTSKTLESTSFLYALIELLIEKGLLTTEELDERKRRLQNGLLRHSKHFLQLQLFKYIIKLAKMPA